MSAENDQIVLILTSAQDKANDWHQNALEQTPDRPIVFERRRGQVQEMLRLKMREGVRHLEYEAYDPMDHSPDVTLILNDYGGSLFLTHIQLREEPLQVAISQYRGQVKCALTNDEHPEAWKEVPYTQEIRDAIINQGYLIDGSLVLPICAVAPTLALLVQLGASSMEELVKYILFSEGFDPRVPMGDTRMN